ncbi:phage tail protein [Burkholderia gladioli]|uniref:phage tail protein n=1 Tax=Burkholderia gladioli TaxID=28095 RepID=UPI0022DBFFDF|nr:phage tail protein [Burkholderia gladioli]MDA0572785.1 phage tail protein [Burkholderia gladioli]MDA0601137.1 phage tail protein [Burkholderia gladioli]
MAGNLIQITDAGRAALVAQGNTGTTARKVVSIGLATASFAFDRGLQALPNERKRVTTFGGDNVAPDTIHVVIQDDTDDQYSLFGFGLYLDNGVLFGVYVQDTAIMEKSPSAILLLAADAVFASIDASQLQFGPTSFLNPPATTIRQGVVELATQDEVKAGTDDVRAVTPLGAAKRYMSYDGGVFNGPVGVRGVAGNDNAQLNISPAGGALSLEGKLRFSATFGDAKVGDTMPRVAASINAGFNGGVWGSEYLDFHLNYVPNDAHDDANMTRVMRLTQGQRTLFGTINDDGVSTIQSAGDIVGLGALTIGRGKARAIVNTDDLTAYFAAMGDGNTMLGATGSGVTSLVTANQERVRVLPSGRVLVGTTADDGRNQLQVAGSIKASTGITSEQLDTGGANFRATSGDYGAMIRNDGRSVYLLSTRQGDPTGQSSDFRPFSWEHANGRVVIDGSGSGTAVGGNVNILGELTVGQAATEAHIRLGPITGYLYSTKDSFGWWTSDTGAFQYYIFDRTFRVDGNRVWHEGMVDPLDKRTGGTISGDVTMGPGKRLFLDEGTALLPSLTFVNDGVPDTGLYHTADGQFGITCNTQAIVLFAADGTRFNSNVYGPTPAAGDRSQRFATTDWVLSAISIASVGQIVFEPRATVRAGYLKANGLSVNRADYPELWAYAQASGALVSDDNWHNGWKGCFSTGNGSSDFRLPDLRGEFIRGWDDVGSIDANRTIGSWQDSQNRSHTHGGATSSVDNHTHGATTNITGAHAHILNDGGHHHQYSTRGGMAPQSGSTTQCWVGDGTGMTDHIGSNISMDQGGDHWHSVSVSAAGAHNHAINADGGNESRPRNIALLAMIRAY